MRKLVFEVTDGERKAEVTAIDLAASAGGLLPNVNRWRKQIELGEMTQEELDKAVTPIPVAGAEGKYIELVGSPDASPRQAILGVVAIRGDRAWFFKLLGDADLVVREKERFQAFVKSVQFAAPKEAAPLAASPTGGDSQLVWDAPSGWSADESGDRRRTAYHVTEGDRQVEITVLELPGTVEKLLPNVNLWRRQVGLEEITQDQLDQGVMPFQVAGMAGHYIELLGPEGAQPRLAALRVLAGQAGKTWLISMAGEADLVLREKERFQAFLNSARFASGKTADEAEPPRVQ